MSADCVEFAFVTYNLKDYYRHPNNHHEMAPYMHTEHFLRRDVVNGSADGLPVIMAVQELPHPRRTPNGLQQLAGATGMQCMVDTGPALAKGGHDDLAVGLMWRGPEYVAGSWRAI